MVTASWSGLTARTVPRVSLSTTAARSLCRAITRSPTATSNPAKSICSPQLAPTLPPRPSVLVETCPSRVVARDHHRLLETDLVHGGPPGGHGRLMGRLRAAVVDHQLSPCLFEADPWVGFARVPLGERVALGRIALTHHLAQLVRAEPHRKGAQPPARLHA